MQIIGVNYYKNDCNLYYKKKKKFLITSRPYPKKFYNFWEFPGGKLEKGEFLIEALRREIREELNVKIKTSNLIFFTSYFVKQKEQKLFLNFFLCNRWEGRLIPREKQLMKWVGLSEVKKFKILKTNDKVIKKLSSFTFSLSTLIEK